MAEKKRAPTNLSETVEKQAPNAGRKKKKRPEILRHNRNLQKRRKRQKKQPRQDVLKAVQEIKETLTAAAGPRENVGIPWKIQGSPRFSLIPQPQALRATLEILRHSGILQKRRKRQKKHPCRDRLRTVQKRKEH